MPGVVLNAIESMAWDHPDSEQEVRVRKATEVPRKIAAKKRLVECKSFKLFKSVSHNQPRYEGMPSSECRSLN